MISFPKGKLRKKTYLGPIKNCFNCSNWEKLVRTWSDQFVNSFEFFISGLYIVLAVLSGLAFILSIGLLMYILHFLYSTIYKLLVVDQRCSCRCDQDSETRNGNAEINGNSQCIMIEITRDLSDPPPTYDQTQDKNLPTYDEVTTASNLSSNEGVTNFGATSE